MQMSAVLGGWARSQAKRGMEFVAARLPRKQRAISRLILCYHGVRDSGSPAMGERTLHIDADAFELQLRAVKLEADVVPLSELLREPSAPARLIAVTFDDAYASALRNGIAICSALNLPSTVFVAPALLGTVPQWDVLAAMGSWTPSERNAWLTGSRSEAIQLKDMSGDPRLSPLRVATEAELRQALTQTRDMMIGNHTFSHANLGAAAIEVQRAEIHRAHEWLSAFARSRYEPNVAYPFGIAPASDAPEAILPEQAFGLIANGGSFGRSLPSGRFHVPRWNVPAEISYDGFRSRVRGRILPHST